VDSPWHNCKGHFSQPIIASLSIISMTIVRQVLLPSSRPQYYVAMFSLQRKFAKFQAIKSYRIVVRRVSGHCLVSLRLPVLHMRLPLLQVYITLGILNLTSLAGCRTWCPTDLQLLCCKALINQLIN